MSFSNNIIIRIVVFSFILFYSLFFFFAILLEARKTRNKFNFTKHLCFRSNNTHKFVHSVASAVYANVYVYFIYFIIKIIQGNFIIHYFKNYLLFFFFIYIIVSDKKNKNCLKKNNLIYNLYLSDIFGFF